MAERTRRYAQREAAPTRVAGPTRTTDADATDRPTAAANSLLDLQATAGNRAVAELIIQRGPGDDAPIVTVPTAAQAADDLQAAEAWLRFVALRGNAPVPSRAVTGHLRGQIAAIQSAVGGPGPIPAKELVVDELAFGEARSAVKRMRADHQQLLPKVPMDAYDQVDLAIDQGQSHFKADETFTDQREQAVVLLGIKTMAETEIERAGEWHQEVPKALRDLPAEAQARFEAAQGGWANRSPVMDVPVTPKVEHDLDLFEAHVAETINPMRERRVADMARSRRAEAEALQGAAQERLAELRVILADKRRSAFASGDDDALDDVSKALGAVAGAIEDTRDAASIITDRVDQLNAFATRFSKAGKALIDMPALPAGITKVADRLVSANEKVKLVIEVMDLLGPAKTKLDEGLDYLKGVDLALEHFAGKSANPFVTVYVGSYLGPGIKNCIASIGTIANIISEDNRRNIGMGMPQAVEWKTEFGGEQMYLFLMSVYRMGGAATLTDEAWRFLSDHRSDLNAAVGAAMPLGRRAVPAWASTNRKALWESFYGSTKPPG